MAKRITALLLLAGCGAYEDPDTVPRDDLLATCVLLDALIASDTTPVEERLAWAHGEQLPEEGRQTNLEDYHRAEIACRRNEMPNPHEAR